MFDWLQRRTRKNNKALMDHPIRRIDLLSPREIVRLQNDRLQELRVLQKHGHADDLPGWRDIDWSNPEAAADWVADFINAPLTEDLRPELKSLAEEIKLQRAI